MRINNISLFIITVIFHFSAIEAVAQSNIFLNKGIFKVYNQSIVSSFSDFVNGSTGHFINDGQIYYYGDFTSNGIYDYSEKLKQGKVIFLSDKLKDKKIDGTSISSFYNVVFDSKRGFDLQTSIDIWGEADFKNGIIKVNPINISNSTLPKGIVSFMPKSKTKNVSNNSFVDGEVEKIGSEEFTFPIGNKDSYRPAIISAPLSKKDVFLSKYVFEDKAFFNTRLPNNNDIEFLNTDEYWIIQKSSQNISDVILTLSWDDQTTPSHLLKTPEENLHIVFWDETKKAWIDQGGIVDIVNRTVTTPIALTNYGYFSLATFKKATSTSDDLIIYNLVTANDDAKNDYFLIENINKYPNNNLQIFNRWGIKVYQTESYDSIGNVFEGYSNVGSKKKLPSGTYYYILTYKIPNEKSFYTLKKVGYLHLDSN